MSLTIFTVNNRLLFKHFITCTKALHPQQQEDPFLANKLNPRINPWFAFGKARLFLAVQESEIVGRIAGFIDPRIAQPSHGYFGLLESVDNLEVCGQLLCQVETWLVSQGKSVSIGPVAFNSNYGVGLLIEGYEQPGHFNLPVNPLYYPTLLENLGYTKEKDFCAYEWGLQKVLPEKFYKAALKAQRDSNLIIRSLVDYSLNKQVQLFSALYQQAMAGSWEFAPLEKKEIECILQGFRAQSSRDLLLIAELHGQPAGLCLTLFKSKGSAKYARAAVLLVAPQFRRRGIEAALITFTIERLKDKGVRAAELSYVAEDNLPVARLISAAGGVLARRYRVYRKSLTS